MNFKSSGLKKIKNFYKRTKKDRKVKPIIKKNIQKFSECNDKTNFEKNKSSNFIF